MTTSIGPNTSFWQVLFSFIPGVFCLSVLTACLPWPLSMLIVTIKNMLISKKEWQRYPPFSKIVGSFQKRLIVQITSLLDTRQKTIIFGTLSSILPPEIILEICSYCTIGKSSDEIGELEEFDHSAVLIEMFYWLQPEYIVLAHKGPLWIFCLNRELFFITMCTIGYISVMCYVWIL